MKGLSKGRLTAGPMEPLIPIHHNAATLAALHEPTPRLCFARRQRDDVCEMRLPRSTEMSPVGRAHLEKLMAAHAVPTTAAAAAELALGEALANVALHAHVADDCRLVLCVKRDTESAGRVFAVLVYESQWFSDSPPEPPWYETHGRGIGIIKTVCREGGGRALWRFRPAGRIKRFGKTLDVQRTIVILERRWTI